MGLTSEDRNNIMLGLAKSPLINPEVVNEDKKDANPESNESKIFQFRKQLKKIHDYEKIVKEDSEQWTDENWEGFEKWVKESSDPIKEVIENRTRRDREEAEEKNRKRAKIIKEALGRL